jgi:IPT/TIG domain
MSPQVPRPGEPQRVPEGAIAFVEQVLLIGGWKGEGPPPTSLPEVGARQLSRIVLAHPAVADGVRSEEPLALFGATDDPRLEDLRYDSLGFLLSGALALGMTGRSLDDLGEPLLHAAVAPDPTSLLLRRQLVGKPFEPPPRLPPEWLDKLDEFMARACFAGVIDAVLELGKWAGGRSTADATGISGVAPASVCPGAQLTISGAGFGATQPTDTRVYVPTGGGCREATVQSWSDTTIVVVLPGDVVAGCVGFVRGGGAVLGEPQRVTGELTVCVGAVAEQWTRGFSKVGGATIVSCPPCLPGGQNRIQNAGRPIVNTFRFTPAQVEPGGQPVLSWSVSNASSLQIARVGTSGPALSLPSPLPMAGSITLAPVGGLVPVTGQYRLTATNSCGQSTADAQFTMTRTPKLGVTRIEVVQSIQTVGNTVRLTANRMTAVRVFVDSGITDGFDLGAGPGRVAGVTASVMAESLDDGSVRSCGSPWPGSQANPSPNRDVLADSFNFDVPLAACQGNVRFRAVVELKGPPGAPPVSFATGSTDVSFTPKPAQELLPLLITDPSSPSPAPTMANFFANLNGFGGPARAQPFPASGFAVNPPLSMTLSAAENLAIGLVWSLLVTKIATMIFLFPSTPVGGIRTGIVPNDGSYPWGGMALPRVGITVPSFIVQAGMSQTTAHELAHTYGQLHANCGGPAGPFGGLPLIITDPGLDIPSRSITPAGSSELMTYCNPQWPSIPHWDTIFNSIPVS